MGGVLRDDGEITCRRTRAFRPGGRRPGLGKRRASGAHGGWCASIDRDRGHVKADFPCFSASRMGCCVQRAPEARRFPSPGQRPGHAATHETTTQTWQTMSPCEGLDPGMPRRSGPLALMFGPEFACSEGATPRQARACANGAARARPDAHQRGESENSAKRWSPAGAMQGVGFKALSRMSSSPTLGGPAYPARRSLFQSAVAHELFSDPPLLCRRTESATSVSKRCRA